MRVVVCEGQLVEGEVIGVTSCSVYYSSGGFGVMFPPSRRFEIGGP
jgi:hypothetical protein